MQIQNHRMERTSFFKSFQFDRLRNLIINENIANSKGSKFLFS